MSDLTESKEPSEDKPVPETVHCGLCERVMEQPPNTGPLAALKCRWCDVSPKTKGEW